MVRLYRTLFLYLVTGEGCAGCLAHEFGVVRLYLPFSSYFVTGETRCAGCLSTFSNHSTTELSRCGEFCHMSSGWFACTEPSLATVLQGKQGVQGA